MLYKQPSNLIHILFEIIAQGVKIMEIQKTFQSHFKLLCVMGQLLYWNRQSVKYLNLELHVNRQMRLWIMQIRREFQYGSYGV
jgi:hypothetical protein